MAVDRRNYNQLVETSVELGNKVRSYGLEHTAERGILLKLEGEGE